MLQTAELIWDFWDVSVSTLQPQANIDEVWVTYVTPANFVGVVLSLGWYSPFPEADTNEPILHCTVPRRHFHEEELENKGLVHETRAGI